MVLWSQIIFIKTPHFKQNQTIHIYKTAVLPQPHIQKLNSWHLETKPVISGSFTNDWRSEIFSLPHRELLEIHLIWGFICCMRGREDQPQNQLTKVWAKKTEKKLCNLFWMFFRFKIENLSYSFISVIMIRIIIYYSVEPELHSYCSTLSSHLLLWPAAGSWAGRWLPGPHSASLCSDCGSLPGNKHQTHFIWTRHGP